jgi:hypothetical protein
MRFSTQLRRKSDRRTLLPVIVCLDEFKVKCLPENGSPLMLCELHISAYSATVGPAVIEDEDNPLDSFSVEKVFYVPEAQWATVNARLRGSGNLMAGIRAFCKARVTEWNTSVLPGGTAATFADLDTDTP